MSAIQRKEGEVGAAAPRSRSETVSGEQADVRLWHQADVQTALMNVRFEGKIGPDWGVTPFSAYDLKRTFIRR